MVLSLQGFLVLALSDTLTPRSIPNPEQPLICSWSLLLLLLLIQIFLSVVFSWLLDGFLCSDVEQVYFSTHGLHLYFLNDIIWWIKGFDFNIMIVIIFFFMFSAFGLLLKKYISPPRTQKYSSRNSIVLLHLDLQSIWNWVLVWSRGQVSFSSTWMSSWPRTLYWKDTFPIGLWLCPCSKSGDHVC